MAVHFVGRRNIADGTVQPDDIVMIDVLSYNSSGVVMRKRNAGADALILDRLVKPFELAVGLRVKRRGFHKGHTGNEDELLKILGYELWPIVVNDPGPSFWKLLLGPLQDDFHIFFRHLLSDLPVNDIAAASIAETTEIVIGTVDVEIGDIHVPVLMRHKRLNEAGPLEAFLLVPLGQEPCF
jgi:hypothetical protein